MIPGETTVAISGAVTLDETDNGTTFTESGSTNLTFGSSVGGAGGGRSTGQRRTNPDYHTDEHWPTPKGVPPVLGATEPEPEPTHDPGMPVIGMDNLPRERRDR